MFYLIIFAISAFCLNIKKTNNINAARNSTELIKDRGINAISIPITNRTILKKELSFTINTPSNDMTVNKIAKIPFSKLNNIINILPSSKNALLKTKRYGIKKQLIPIFIDSMPI